MHYCGIDVAKGKHDVVVIDDKGKIVRPAFQVQSNREGFDKLVSELSSYAGELSIGIESTGHYWLTLYDALTRHQFRLTLLNPMQIHAYRKIDIRKRKTDRQDAYWIADFMRFANPKPTSERIPVFIQLRELSRFRFRLSQQIGDCKRKIICILDRVFPEYEQLFSNVFLRSSRRLLEEAVTADDFVDFDLAELAAILNKASRGRFGQSKAEEIQTLARRSVGVSFLADAIHVEMRCLLEQITLLEQQQKQVEVSLEELMDQVPQFITTIPGIGLATGAALLGEIGDVNRFQSADKLVAYAGIDPSVYKSGQFEGNRMHMSKRGAPSLRHALWQAASVARLHNPELKQYYEKKRAEGKPHGVALGAVCRKLLIRVYVVLKEERPYEIR